MRDNETARPWFDERARHLVRPYTITRGRTRPTQDTLNLITHVVANGDVDTRDVEPEAVEILTLCRDQALSVAEIAAKANLPISVVKVLLGDLLDVSAIVTKAPIAVAEMPDIQIVDAVLDGLRELL
ncbi:MAG: DUF742 domain-containing protein [Streptosporangiales bacterium]|nr:DUF742 domain-containing protein [Streptosporangiales bacterium]